MFSSYALKKSKTDEELAACSLTLLKEKMKKR